MLARVKRGLSFECKIDQDDFADWISFLASNLIEEITPNPKPSTHILRVFRQYGLAEKKCDIANWIAYLYW